MPRLVHVFLVISFVPADTNPLTYRLPDSVSPQPGEDGGWGMGVGERVGDGWCSGQRRRRVSRLVSARLSLSLPLCLRSARPLFLSISAAALVSFAFRNKKNYLRAEHRTREALEAERGLGAAAAELPTHLPKKRHGRLDRSREVPQTRISREAAR